MSIALPLARSSFLKEALRRSVSTSRILVKARVLGSKIQDTFNLQSNKESNLHNIGCIRLFSMGTSSSKEEEKKKRAEMIEQKKDSVKRAGHKFSQLGGPQVIAAYFGLEFLCIGGFYAAFKAGLVSPDAIVALMNRWEFTAKFSHIIANNPNASLFTLAYASTKVLAPIRFSLIAAYGTYVVKNKKSLLKRGIHECSGHKKDGGCGGHEGGCGGHEGGCGGHEGGCGGHEGGCCGKHGGGCGGHEGGCGGHEGGCCGKHEGGGCGGHGEGGCCGGHEGGCGGRRKGREDCCGKHDGSCGHRGRNGKGGCGGRCKENSGPNECLVEVVQ